jgi:hypothetical protein
VRNSDRWVTPAVIVTGLLVAGGLCALLIAAVAYLSARGVDPDPMLKTVGALVAAATSVGTLLLQLVNRQTVAKTERNTGVLAAAVYDVADAIPRPGGPRHAYLEQEAAPAASGSRGPA